MNRPLILGLAHGAPQSTLGCVFEEAQKRFEEMSLDEYKQTYGPKADYLDAMPYNPNDAVNMDAIKERISLTPAQYTNYETLGVLSLGASPPTI